METLELDYYGRAKGVLPWHKAIVKTVLDKDAVVREVYRDKYIHTPNPVGEDIPLLGTEPVERGDEILWRINMPAVIQLLAPHTDKHSVKFSRKGIYLRDKGRCQYCGLRVERDDFEMEHVVPRSQGGHTNWQNIVVACTACNQKKGGRTPEQAGMRLICKPVRPKSLPGVGPGKMIYRSGMPDEWVGYLRSVAYWHSELESD